MVNPPTQAELSHAASVLARAGGALGGKSRSKRKQAASRKSLIKARRALAIKRREAKKCKQEKASA